MHLFYKFYFSECSLPCSKIFVYGKRHAQALHITLPINMLSDDDDDNDYDGICYHIRSYQQFSKLFNYIVFTYKDRYHIWCCVYVFVCVCAANVPCLSSSSSLGLSWVKFACVQMNESLTPSRNEYVVCINNINKI